MVDIGNILYKLTVIRNILPVVRVIAVNGLCAEAGPSNGQIVIDTSGFLFVPSIPVDILKHDIVKRTEGIGVNVYQIFPVGLG